MIDFETFKQVAEEKVKSLIVIDNKCTQLFLGKFKLIHLDGLYSIYKNNKLLCDEIVSYDIALLIIEDKIKVNDAILLDNEYYKYYNDILLNKRYDNCIADSRTLESIINLSKVLKTIKSKRTLSTYFDKYKK